MPRSYRSQWFEDGMYGVDAPSASVERLVVVPDAPVAGHVIVFGTARNVFADGGELSGGGGGGLPVSTGAHKVLFDNGTTQDWSDSPVLAGLTVAGLAYPAADGTSGQVLATNGAGVLSFVDAGGGTASALQSTGVGLIRDPDVNHQWRITDGGSGIGHLRLDTLELINESDNTDRAQIYFDTGVLWVGASLISGQTIQATTGYKSSDGSSGQNYTLDFGNGNTLTVKNGLITGKTGF